MIGRDGWAGLVVLAFCAVLYWLTLGLKGNPLVPIGPAFYPRIVIGITAAFAALLYAFAAAVQPGPFQTYLISSALTHGLRRTLPAVLAPLLSDVPIIALVLLVLTQVPHPVVSALRLAGGAYLLYLAHGAFVSYRNYEAPGTSQPAHAARTLIKAAIVNVLNPNPYLSWSLVLGPLLLQEWRAAPAHAVALIVSFYVTLIASTAVILVPFAGARTLGPRVGRTMVGISAVALAAFGLYQLWAVGVSLLGGHV